MPAGTKRPGKSAKVKRRHDRQHYLNKKIEMFKGYSFGKILLNFCSINGKCIKILEYSAAGVDDIQVEYKNNGEFKEVYYYKKVAVDEKEPGQASEQPEAVKEVRVPVLGLKQKAPQKYKKPKIQPKVSPAVCDTISKIIIVWLICMHSNKHHIAIWSHVTD